MSKESENLRERSLSEENDLKAIGLGKKLIREERKETFEEDWLPQLRKECIVNHDSVMGRYTFQTLEYGVVDFYPKANKLLIRKLNKWVKPGLRWIIQKLRLTREQ